MQTIIDVQKRFENARAEGTEHSHLLLLQVEDGSNGTKEAVFMAHFDTVTQSALDNISHTVGHVVAAYDMQTSKFEDAKIDLDRLNVVELHADAA